MPRRRVQFVGRRGLCMLCIAVHIERMREEARNEACFKKYLLNFMWGGVIIAEPTCECVSWTTNTVAPFNAVGTKQLCVDPAAQHPTVACSSMRMHACAAR
jgi:hypothetical protein